MITQILDTEACTECEDHLNAPYPGIPFVLGFNRWEVDAHNRMYCIYRYTFGEVWCGYEALEVWCYPESMGGTVVSWILVRLMLENDGGEHTIGYTVLAARVGVPSGLPYRPYCDEFGPDDRIYFSVPWWEVLGPCSAVGTAQFELWMGN